MSQRILSLGAMYFEINTFNFPLPDSLTLETETVGGEYNINPGGSAINFARVCSSLGLSPVFVGKLGSGVIGEELTKMMREEGIEPAFIVDSSVQTNFAINFARKDGKTLMFVNGTANQSLGPEEVEHQLAENLAHVNYLYLGGSLKLSKLLPVYPEIISKAKELGVKIAPDHGRKNSGTTNEEIEMIKRVVAGVDYYFPSKDELLSVWEAESIEEAVGKIQNVSEAMVVVKDAENGVYGFFDEKSVHVTAFSVDVRSTVGAGDSFNAGFIKAQSEGLDFGKSLRFGCATAAIKISQKELPTLDQVQLLCQTS